MALNIGSALRSATHVGGLPLFYEKVGIGGSKITFNEPLRKMLYGGAAVMGAVGVARAALTYQDPATRVFDMSARDPVRGRHGSNYAMDLHYANRG